VKITYIYCVTVLYIPIFENIIDLMIMCLHIDTEVKRKIKSLRSAYAREKDVIEKSCNMNGKPNHLSMKKRWCYFDKLRFLDGVYPPKSRFSQVSFL